MKKESGTTMNQHVNEFMNKAEQLQEAGINLPEDLLFIMLLGSLPDEFESFSVAIESRDEVPSVDTLKIKLLEDEARQNERNGRSDRSNDDALVTKAPYSRGKQKNTKDKLFDTKGKSNTQKFSGNCYTCGKIGHKNSDCRSKVKRNESNKVSDPLTAIVCEAEVQKTDLWCLDSGATRHMCNDK